MKGRLFCVCICIIFTLVILPFAASHALCWYDQGLWETYAGKPVARFYSRYLCYRLRDDNPRAKDVDCSTKVSPWLLPVVWKARVIGGEVTDVSSLSGLKFDYLLLVDVNASCLREFKPESVRRCKIWASDNVEFSVVRKWNVEYMSIYRAGNRLTVNLGYDGSLKLDLLDKNITSLDEFEGLELNSVSLQAENLVDISVLKDMPLLFLDIEFTGVQDFSPLYGKTFRRLVLPGGTEITGVFNPPAEEQSENKTVGENAEGGTTP